MSKWFKVYGEILTDPKMISLRACEKYLWIVILCLASEQEKDGVIPYLTEERLKVIAGIGIDEKDWEEVDGVLKKFEKLKLIRILKDKVIVINFKKRQETNLTTAERQARHRLKMRENEGYDGNEDSVTLVTGGVTQSNARREKKRIEENRQERKRGVSSNKKTKGLFMGREVRRTTKDDKLWILPEGGGHPWLEFGGKESEIEWR